MGNLLGQAAWRPARCSASMCLPARGRAYQAARRALVDELGLEPGRALREFSELRADLGVAIGA